MKVMQINAVYPTGSTGKIVNDIHKQLMDNGIESIVCYGRGNKIKEKNVYKIAPEFIMKLQSLRSKITGYIYSGCLISTMILINIIKKEKPDVVHLQCINSYIVNIYKLLNYLKSNNIPTVLTLHAEFMYTAGCGHALECEKWKSGCNYCPQKGTGRPSSKIFDKSEKEWQMMKKSFEGFNNLVIVPVSQWLCDRAKQSPFLSKKEFEVITNGIDTSNIFKPTDYNELKRKFGFKNEKLILHVTPNFCDPLKGGNYVLEIAKRTLKDNIKVIIVGYNGKLDNLPNNVIVIPHTKDQNELAAYYTMADVTLITSKKETFSMVCAESLSCGTPVVGFKAGAPEMIAIKEYSEFVEYGDIDALEATIRCWLDIKNTNFFSINLNTDKIYSKELMYKKYNKIYERINMYGKI